MKPHIGFIGLGLMGSGMARNFLTKGYPLTVYNRSTGPAELLARDGAKIAVSPWAVASASDFIFTCVSGPKSVKSMAFGPDGLLAGAKSGARWIETSTIGREASEEMDRAAKASGVGYLEAPVTGSKMGAKNGTLVVMTGGEKALH